jgi:uncharacterized integral membrane protein
VFDLRCFVEADVWNTREEHHHERADSRGCDMARDDETTHDRSIRWRQSIRILVWVAVVAVLVVVAAVNTQDVDVDWVLDESTLPLWLVIAGAAAAGVVVGYIARWRRD